VPNEEHALNMACNLSNSPKYVTRLCYYYYYKIKKKHKKM